MSSIKSPRPPMETKFVDADHPSGLSRPWQQWLSQVQPNFADDITPTGLVNGANTTFTLPQIPNPVTSLKVYADGKFLVRTVDYVLTGATFVTTVAPAVSIRCYYRFQPQG